jgi:hypothetical protein
VAAHVVSEDAATFRIRDHRPTDTILDAATGIAHLEFRHDPGEQTLAHPV